MAATYEPIATQTLTSSQSSVSFTSIPSTYTDLVLVFNGEGTTDDNVVFRFNSDSGSNYSNTRLSNNGNTPESAGFSNDTWIRYDYRNYLSTARNTTIYYLMNYSNTNTYKTVLIRNNKGASAIDAAIGLWRSTSAISSIYLGAPYASGSTFTLYGIKAE